MKHQRPYFKLEEVEALVRKFTESSLKEGHNVSAKLVAQFREYIQAPKHVYENNILKHVLEGTYEVSYLDGRVAFRVNLAAVSSAGTIENGGGNKSFDERLQELGSQLNNSMLIINSHNKQDRAMLSNYAKNFSSAV